MRSHHFVHAIIKARTKKTGQQEKYNATAVPPLSQVAWSVWAGHWPVQSTICPGTPALSLAPAGPAAERRQGVERSGVGPSRVKPPARIVRIIIIWSHVVSHNVRQHVADARIGPPNLATVEGLRVRPPLAPLVVLAPPAACRKRLHYVAAGREVEPQARRNAPPHGPGAALGVLGWRGLPAWRGWWRATA
jgi:hypothetical protein